MAARLLNQVQISFPSSSVNEGFARAAVAAFLAQADQIGRASCRERV